MGWRLYGVRGWGSTLAEAALAWVGEPVEFIDVEGFDQPGPARDRLLAVNPLARVPTLVAPDGEILTESAAIVLRLAELHPPEQARAGRRRSAARRLSQPADLVRVGALPDLHLPRLSRALGAQRA